MDQWHLRNIYQCFSSVELITARQVKANIIKEVIAKSIAAYFAGDNFTFNNKQQSIISSTLGFVIVYILFLKHENIMFIIDIHNFYLHSRLHLWSVKGIDLFTTFNFTPFNI